MYMQNKITLSKHSALVWFIFLFFLKVILCEIKGHCLELVLYHGFMMDGWVRALHFSNSIKVDNHVSLPGLFCTSIRTEPERKSVIMFLILKGFSCNKRQIPRYLLQKYNIEYICRNAL